MSHYISREKFRKKSRETSISLFKKGFFRHKLQNDHKIRITPRETPLEPLKKGAKDAVEKFKGSQNLGYDNPEIQRSVQEPLQIVFQVIFRNSVLNIRELFSSKAIKADSQLMTHEQGLDRAKQKGTFEFSQILIITPSGAFKHVSEEFQDCL